jgi:putative SOS response-associated peptidase YedK
MTVTSAPASAASSNARLVCDFDPGASTRPFTGPDAGGAGQPAFDELTRPSLRTAWDDRDMCGRYASTRTSAEIAEEFTAVDSTGSEAPEVDYNVAPTKPVLAVVQRHPRDDDGTPDRSRTERSVRVLRWGLVPSWSKDPSGAARMINARAETAAEKPAFRKALASRRCLMPAEGWYEWKRGVDSAKPGAKSGSKQPYFVTGTDGASLAMAGLWEFWRTPNGEGDPQTLITCAVLTTDAVGPLAEIHHRMPLLLPAEHWDEWLDPDAADPTGMLAPPSPELVAGLELRPVSALVNNVRNQGPELLVPAPIEEREADPPALELDLSVAPDSSLAGPR